MGRPQRVLILGTGTMAAKVIEAIETCARSRYALVGVVDEDSPRLRALAGTARRSTSDRLAEIFRRVRPARIVVALKDRRGHLPFKALLDSRAHGVVVEDALDFYERLTGKMAIESLTPGSLILSKGFRNHKTAQALARVISVLTAIAGLLLFAPLLLLIAALIKIDSPGPVFFVQDRAGRDGRPFRLLKLRTMHPCDAPRSEWVRDNTDRITRLGRYLRRFRVDELPQLLNVLRGDMNLIGPRPHPVCNHHVFMEQVAYYGLRSTIRPGVTGWAQIRYGYANNLEEETEKMRYDLYYIKNRTLLLDVRILLETFFIMVFGQGATGVRKRPLRSGPIRHRVRKPASDPSYLPWIPESVQPPAGSQ